MQKDSFQEYSLIVINNVSTVSTVWKLLSIVCTFHLKPDNSNSHEFELHRPSNKGTKLLLKVIKAIIIIL